MVQNSNFKANGLLDPENMRVAVEIVIVILSRSCGLGDCNHPTRHFTFLHTESRESHIIQTFATKEMRKYTAERYTEAFSETSVRYKMVLRKHRG